MSAAQGVLEVRGSRFFLWKHMLTLTKVQSRIPPTIKHLSVLAHPQKIVILDQRKVKALFTSYFSAIWTKVLGLPSIIRVCRSIPSITLTERVDPERSRIDGITTSNVPCYAFTKAKLGKYAKSNGKPVLEVGPGPSRTMKRWWTGSLGVTEHLFQGDTWIPTAEIRLLPGTCSSRAFARGRPLIDHDFHRRWCHCLLSFWDTFTIVLRGNEAGQS